jgi:hypothetical protein
MRLRVDAEIYENFTLLMEFSLKCSEKHIQFLTSRYNDIKGT